MLKLCFRSFWKIWNREKRVLSFIEHYLHTAALFFVSRKTRFKKFFRLKDLLFIVLKDLRNHLKQKNFFRFVENSRVVLPFNPSDVTSTSIIWKYDLSESKLKVRKTISELDTKKSDRQFIHQILFSQFSP